MRTLIISFCVLVNAAVTFAQGLVNFANTPTTPVYYQTLNSTTQSILSGPAGSYYFGLFLGAFDSSYFFTGAYATNTGVNGLFNGGVEAVPGWVAGTSANYFVAGWDASMGHTFRPEWLMGSGLVFGTSGIGSGIAGDGTSTQPLNLFNGGGNTLHMGFILFDHTIPEIPEASTLSIGGFGAGVIYSCILKQRGRNKPKTDQK